MNDDDIKYWKEKLSELLKLVDTMEYDELYRYLNMYTKQMENTFYNEQTNFTSNNL
jgi:hypothetical protein